MEERLLNQRGAAMLYAVLLSVVCATLVAGVVRIVGQSANDQVRREKLFKARAFADEQLAILISQAKDGSLTVPGTLSRSGSGMTLTADYASSGTITGLVNVNQTVTSGRMSFLFRDSIGMYIPPPIPFYFASMGYGSDAISGGATAAANADDIPDWLAADMNATGTPLTRVTVSDAQFVGQTYNVPANALTTMCTSIGLTTAQFANYDFIAFSVANSTNPTFTGTDWEFWKADISLRVSAGGTGTYMGTVPTATYQSMFGLGASPLSGTTTVKVILFDFDAMTGGATFKADASQLLAIVKTTATTTAPRIDSMARLDSVETSPQWGAFVEAGVRVSNNGDGYTSSIITRGPTDFPTTNTIVGTDAPLGAVAGDTFASYSATLIPPTTGGYEFRFYTDDGSRLWLNDVNILTSWKTQASTLYKTPLKNLTAGVSYPLWYEWYNSGGYESRRLEWKPPGGVFELIPDQYLRPTGGTEPVGRGFWSFDDDVSTGWSLTSIRVAGNGPGVFGVPNANGISSNSYLGDFGYNSQARLSLGTVSAGRIVVTYEAYITAGWETATPNGPDYLRLYANNSLVASIMGADTAEGEVSTTLPLVSRTVNGSWRIMRVEFQHSGGALTLDWRKESPTTADVNNESWFLDNVSVRRKL